MPLIVVALLYFAGWFLIWVVAAALLVGVVGFGTLASLLSGDPSEAGIALLSAMGMGTVIVLLLAALLGVPLIMAYWYAPALVLFRGEEPIKAMRTSFTACMRNVPPFFVYGLLGIVFAVRGVDSARPRLARADAGLRATIYTSYKDIFGEPA